MENNKQKLSYSGISKFRIPRYTEIPDVGLYLEQTAKYINSYLALIGFEITGSMIRNYVKMGLVKNPVQKQYYAEHIIHLIAITVLKNVLSLEDIATLFDFQKKVYKDEVAYDYFCMELENMILYQFSYKDNVDKIGVTSSLEKKMLRSAIIAVSHITFLKVCLTNLTTENNTDNEV